VTQCRKARGIIGVAQKLDVRATRERRYLLLMLGKDPEKLRHPRLGEMHPYNSYQHKNGLPA